MKSAIVEISNLFDIEISSDLAVSSVVTLEQIQAAGPTQKIVIQAGDIPALRATLQQFEEIA
jgi:hypothetical protein